MEPTPCSPRHAAASGRGSCPTFGTGDGERSQRLMQVLDAVNARLGRGARRFGTGGFRQPWAMRQAHRSPAYTTRWEEVPQVG